MKLLSCVDRAINPEAYMNETVYDLDQLCSTAVTPDPNAQKRFVATINIIKWTILQD